MRKLVPMEKIKVTLWESQLEKIWDTAYCGGGGVVFQVATTGGNHYARVGFKTDSQHSLHYRCILQITKEFCVARSPFWYWNQTKVTKLGDVHEIRWYQLPASENVHVVVSGPMYGVDSPDGYIRCSFTLYNVMLWFDWYSFSFKQMDGLNRLISWKAYKFKQLLSLSAPMGVKTLDW
jgi:hypothetical protein